MSVATTEPDASAPDASTLGEAEAAFARGDFARVRVLTSAITGSLDHQTRLRALALRRRVSVDPIGVAIWLVSFAFFLAVCARYFGST